MKETEIKELTNKQQVSLFRVNLFYYLAVLLLIFLGWLSCKETISDFNAVVNNFKNNSEVICSNTFVSKQRGWSIDESKKIFLKGDNFFEIKTCEEE